MIITHGNIYARPAIPHPAYTRFVAVLDVLGMKAWLEKEKPRSIAETLHEALLACDQSSAGDYNGTQYGPIIGTTHFSDTLLAWSPDDSWASFGTMCSAIKMIVTVALSRGVSVLEIGRSHHAKGVRSARSAETTRLRNSGRAPRDAGA